LALAKKLDCPCVTLARKVRQVLDGGTD
jgi:hypothetical protein